MNAEPSLRNEMELQALKRRAKEVEVRLGLLMERVRKLERDVRPTSLLAFVDPEKCIACGACLDLCPAGALWLDRIAHVDPARCMGCGRCVEACSQGAIRLQRTKQTLRDAALCAS